MRTSRFALRRQQSSARYTGQDEIFEAVSLTPKDPDRCLIARVPATKGHGEGASTLKGMADGTDRDYSHD